MAPDSPATPSAVADRDAPAELGAVPREDGTSFALYSEHAEQVDLCLYDQGGQETARLPLPGHNDHVFHGFVPQCRVGQHYGFRVHGPYEPANGMRFNPAKLLLDPYARQVTAGGVQGLDALGYLDGRPDDADAISRVDSAAQVPKAIVTASTPPSATLEERFSWAETVIYEANVRGFTMRHPALNEAERGTFTGLANGQILRHLKALGITAIELLPVHAFLDEPFLKAKGLRNFWGYNSIGFFAPQPRYAAASANPQAGTAVDEFRLMVDAIHDAGIEVILDVVYNHTAEGNRYGPTISLRGIDNVNYYRLSPDNAAHYINDTGCGNTINADSAVVQRLVVDSLCYWANEMGVDGFRFDLAPILGRSADGFKTDHPLLTAIRTAPALEGKRLIAEPWDVGPGGYQLGHFPPPFAEWNDKYRDTVRRFWCSNGSESAEFARRLHGSADLFEHDGRGPPSSINFITSHDGFTLRDLVSYESRHNEANGEDNRDGHKHNYSRNHGVEGETDDERILAIRRRQRLNLLTTLLVSQGTPMLLAGDEFGNSQLGNNNAYAQDNELGWIDWSGLDDDPAFIRSVANLLELRRRVPLLRQANYVHGEAQNADGQRNIDWLAPDSRPLADDEWQRLRSLTLLLVDPAPAGEIGVDAVAILFNADEAAIEFILPPASGKRSWRCEFATCTEAPVTGDGPWLLEPRSVAVFRRSKFFRT